MTFDSGERPVMADSTGCEFSTIHAADDAKRSIGRLIRSMINHGHASDAPEAAGTVTPLAVDALASCKQAYTTRRCRLTDARQLVTGATPRAGDLVLAKVAEVGQHGGLQTVSGRRATLFAGDEIVVAYGNRYAPDQFHAVVPPDLGPCQLAAGGGIASRVLASHGKMRRPTQLVPTGLLADASGRILNVADYALPRIESRVPRPVTIAVVGTSMNSGKTTTAAHLVRGLRAAGLAVSAAKVTGTGAGGDPWLMRDAGAAEVLDFTDAGFASTYKLPLDALCGGIERILDCLGAHGSDVVVVEIADGLFQHETAELLSSRRASDYFNLFLFAAQDAMGAATGVGWLEERGLQVAAIAGLLTVSPLAAREAERAVGLPALKLGDLSDPAQARRCFETARRARDTHQALKGERAA